MLLLFLTLLHSSSCQSVICSHGYSSSSLRAENEIYCLSRFTQDIHAFLAGLLALVYERVCFLRQALSSTICVLTFQVTAMLKHISSTPTSKLLAGKEVSRTGSPATAKVVGIPTLEVIAF